MPDGIDIKVTVKGLRQVQQMLRKLGASVARGAGTTSLHARYAIIASQWIDRNFQQQGGLVGGWRALRPNTIAGRRKGSSVILQDTGLLRASFVPAWDEKAAVVGSASKVSLWHEKGTKGSPETPYPIRPKRPGGVLAFPVAAGTAGSTLVPILPKNFKKGDLIFGRKLKSRTMMFRRMVMHPGLPRRIMLPTERDLLPQLLKTTINYVREQEQRGQSA
mgnify:FL=1